LAEVEYRIEAGHHSSVSPAVLNVLEILDNFAHVLVAIFFVVLAGSVLVYASILLVRDMPLITQAPAAAVSERPAGTEVAPDVESAAPAAVERAPEKSTSLFLSRSLELLSTLLFVVIVLELLKTIITYLKTHNIQAIMKEFLVVGIISSIRKILLVGAESSLGSADPTSAYIKEAGGTVITIAGILLLIAGLIFLQRSEMGSPATRATAVNS
jgi:uncharacterized membrane protein (DUF373 family)